MSINNPVPFLISSIDSLGQGVSKITDKITFVPKTLPGEEGSARILSTKSQVAFAELISINKPSLKRLDKPLCVHFDKCPGCHYLHTDYSYELELKLLGMKGLFRHYPDLNHHVISSNLRTGYRNRVQLHYDLTNGRLGFQNSRNHTIIEIPHCLIAQTEVQREIQSLYLNSKWKDLAPKNQKKGHVEIYFNNNEVKLTWNKPYADGGFTQVHEEMNTKLKSKVQEIAANYGVKSILDLFGGNGNLSNSIDYDFRLCVDVYKTPPQSPEFLSENLYGENALKKVSKKILKTKIDMLILDPPRSGLKNLKEWAEAFDPQFILYVSCDPHTQVRDIKELDRYQISQSYLLDLFPSTYHFETLVFLERKN